MPIIRHEQSREFHIYNNDISYIIGTLENEQLENLYYGKRIKDRESFQHFHEEVLRSVMAFNAPAPSMMSLQYQRQEYPSYGTGDFRLPAVEVCQKNGSKITAFKYRGYEILKGKKPLEELPATYVEDDNEATTLEITLYDEVIEMEMILSYTIYEQLPVITRNVRFYQKGAEGVVLSNAMSANVDLPDADFEMVHLSGAWGRERYVKNRKLEHGIQSVYSLRGASSAEHNPFIALKRENTTEQTGEVYGFSFVYSGNFLGQVEVCTHDTTRIMMGLHPHMFEWSMEQGDCFQTPEVVMVYTDKGLNQMSQTYHKLYRTRLARGYWRDQASPILLNNWEATSMDFTEEKILDIAKKANEAGVELFVLDDGWFGKRNTEHAGLGDWYANYDKLPNGISGFSQKIEDLGMKFGIWIEPEMVNKDSDLYRAHPDWMLATPKRFESPSRFQHVLDFSRKEVVDYIHNLISKMMREAKISYIKWDMNRYITECFSATAETKDQGKVMHRYILGVYDLYRRLTEEFPKVLFESCASGGARFDPAMLYFAPQAWTSDDTDANERLKIQYGTSFVYPVSSMGAHITESPNQQLFRNTPLETRANVAYFGTFGYEMDLNDLSTEEIEVVKQQICYMKEHRDLIQKGTFYRILSPFEGNEAAWIVVAEDASKAVAGFYQSRNRVNAGLLRLKLVGLEDTAEYKVTMGGTISIHYGDELMNAGIVIDREILSNKGGDFASIIYDIEKMS